ncbi:MAG: cupin domain-containing protein [bacterium]|jgi:mannose-6-phosphate isomerase-like protein (cupin superfamily)|nr:cupin domain-containing protein [bacterium]
MDEIRQPILNLVARHKNEVQPQICPCGSAVRILTKADSDIAGFHITTIRDAAWHYHKKTTEIYHVLEGKGRLEVGDACIPLTPGMTVLIPVGVPHRGEGDFKTIIVSVPPFDAEDEFCWEPAP